MATADRGGRRARRVRSRGRQLVEAAGRQVLEQTIPAGYAIGQTWANPASPHCPPPGEICPLVRRQLDEGCLAWVYLGHGWHTELDRVATPAGERPLLCLDDVPQLTCGAESPLAVLVACYTGAIDAPQDCLGEELLLAEHGPVAVIAATRVSMPYGNAVLGCELLRACFRDEAATVGDMLRTRAGANAGRLRRAIALRTSLDGLARGLSPPPVDLATERREHVMMYQLLGDPLLRLCRPHELPLETSAEVAAGERADDRRPHRRAGRVPGRIDGQPRAASRRRAAGANRTARRGRAVSSHAHGAAGCGGAVHGAGVCCRSARVGAGRGGGGGHAPGERARGPGRPAQGRNSEPF